MEFRILGHLEIRDGGRPVEVRGRRQRALLALLLIRANEPVGDERLLEELWGEHTPESGTTAVRVRVSQLRKALGADVIVTRPSGYALEVEPERIDARRFERLVAEGRSELEAGDGASAAATLRQALALWRGPAALADFEYEPFADAERARLEDLRLDALEDRIEADLALGRQLELVGELEPLVAQNPFRERLRGQLMLALYRCGRQADALAAYRDARRTMVEELGIEPGPALQQLEQAILRQDDRLGRRDDDGGRAPTEERKVITVVAADVAGAGDADPERERALLDRVAAEARDVVLAADGRVEATIAGTFLAAFGAPVAHEDHAERGLATALALRLRIAEAFGGEVSARIGVESGEAVVDAAIAGAPVAAAMRLAQGARDGEILVGARTVAGVRGAFEFGTPRRLGSPLVGAAAAGTARVRHRTAFVGRTDELDLLLAAYRRVAETRAPELVTVVGEAGVGKSRLVWELWELLAAEEPAPTLRLGRCLPYGRETTYAPLGDVLREELGVLETDSPEEVLERLGQRGILGVTLGLDAVGTRHPLTVRDELHEAWVDVAEELVAERPAVIVVEDLHWAQEPLLELLDRLVRRVRGPVLLLATARPDLARPPGTSVRLEPLADAELEEMLAGVEPALRADIVARAEGNPFFAEELVAHAAEEDAPADGAAPASIHSVLAARIDRLPAAEKAAVQAAAVVGRIFWAGAVRELLDGADADFGVLEERGFVRRRATTTLRGEQELMFKHALTRDVAYAGLPRRRRARLHAALVRWLERVVGSGGEHAALLAHHAFEAVRPEDADLAWDDPAELEPLRASAVARLQRAAAGATSRYELDQAIAFLENALRLAATDDVRCDLWRALGRAHALRHDGEAFWTALERALEHAGDDSTRGELYAELAFETCNRSGMWVRRPEAELVEQWVEQALALAEPDSAACGRALVTETFLSPAESRGSAERALDVATRLDDPALLSAAWDALRLVALLAADWDGEIDSAERRLELVDRIDDPDLHGDVFATLVPVYIRRGRWKEAEHVARRTDEVTKALSSHHRVHGVAVLLEVSEARGTWDEIRALEERARHAVADNEATPCVRNARSLLLCALASEQLGDAARAAELEARAEEVALEGFGHVLDTPRLRLALARGDLGRAEELVESPPVGSRIHVVGRGFDVVSWAARLDALGALRDRERVEREAPPLLGAGPYLESFALRALGLVSDDEELLSQALARFESLGLAWEAEQTRVALAG
jgi:DNA-binding SARP family transcriptional activator